MKYYIRRAIVGIIAVPIVAGAWVLVYAFLLLLGGEPNQSIADTFGNGLALGWILAVLFTFAPQVGRLLDRIG